MSLAKVTIIGQEQFLQQNDNTHLFDLLQLPTGIDKDLLVDNIFLEAGDFESMYDNPYFMRNMISVWSRKWYRTFEKWVAVLSMDYNPLENYDRKEFWEDKGKLNSKRTLDTTENNGITSDGTLNGSTTDHQTSEGYDTGNITGTSSTDVTETGSKTTGSTVENTVSAFDASTYQPADKTESSGSESTRNTSDTDGSTTQNSTSSTVTTIDGSGTTSEATHSHTDSARLQNDTENVNRGSDDEHRGRIHGNIGVKTTQSMLAEELEVQRFNIINEITDIFVTEFCILVYD